jgi:hypothetical protein
LAATSARALDLPPDGVFPHIPVYPLPGPLPKPEPWPLPPTPGPVPLPKPMPPHPGPCPIVDPIIITRPESVSMTAIPRPMNTLAFDGNDDGCTHIPGQDKHPTPPTPRHQDQLAFDGTDGGCTKIPGEDKHPTPPTPPTPRHSDQYV